MAGLFDDVPDAPQAAPAAAAAKGGLFDDVPDAKPAGDPSLLARAGHVAADVAQSAGAGIIRGAASLPDLPATLMGLGDAAVGGLVRMGGRAIGKVPASDRGIDTSAPFFQPPKPGEAAVHVLEDAKGKLYEPQTLPGEYARTLGEFIPGGGKSVAGAVKAAIAPAIASEAAGQVTKGSAVEPYARLVGGLAAGGAQALRERPGTAERLFDKSAGQISPEEFGQVQSLVSDAAARGVSLTWPEALQHVVGPRRMGDLLRVVEGQGGLSEFFAQRPEQIRAAGGAGLDTIAPAGATPTQVGEAVQTAAQAGVAGTQQGQSVIRATQAAGPRVTADQAGQVIQREMRGVADAREARRADQAATDYEAARNAPENAGVERTIEVERPGEPIVTRAEYGRPQFTANAPRPLEAPTRPAPAAERSGPDTLSRFIAKNGGLEKSPDVVSQDFHKVVVPGIGTLARDGGKSIDGFWRVKLMEAGYLPRDADGYATRDIRGELMRKLRNEQNGVPTYPIGSEREMAAALQERMRPSQVANDYEHALDLATSRFHEDLTNAGVDPKTIHPDVESRVLGALMRGEHVEPLDAYERVVSAMREQPTPYSKSTTVTEEISDVRFGQVDAQPAIDALDRQVRSAKGDVRASLEGIRRDLYEHGTDPKTGVREPDMSVEGLLHARERIDQHIDAAREVGDATKVRDLTIVRRSLDAQVKQVPEVATADARFAANSRPLEAFGGNTPLGRVTARDERTGRMQTPAEQVPGQLQGASAAREFLANATPEARRAFEGREVTRILDGVSGGEGGASARTIRAAMRREEDLLAQMPEARARLNTLANRYEAREAVDRSPLGRLAERPDLKNAFDVLFPTKPVEGSAAEVGQAVRAIARSNPVAARQAARSYLGTQFAEMTQDLQSGSNQAGGAKFAVNVRGNALQSENLTAVLRALPNGEAIERGYSRLLDIMEATGKRQSQGSKTTFNTEAISEMRRGPFEAEMAKAGLSGGFHIPKQVAAFFENLQLHRSLDRLADLMTSPEGGQRLAQLATAKPGASTIALLQRLTNIAGRSYGAGQPSAGSEGEPLKLTVRPVP